MSSIWTSTSSASGSTATVAAEVAAASSKGPYGHFPKGPLSTEDAPGPTWKMSEAGRQALGARLAAAFEHTHMLVFHPRDASAPSLQSLLDAGWSYDWMDKAFRREGIDRLLAALLEAQAGRLQQMRTPYAVLAPQIDQAFSPPGVGFAEPLDIAECSGIGAWVVVDKGGVITQTHT